MFEQDCFIYEEESYHKIEGRLFYLKTQDLI